MRLLWSNFYIYVLFSFSVFLVTSGNSDLRNLIDGTRVPSVQVYIETNPRWLELPLTGTNFHGLSLFEPLKFCCKPVNSIVTC